MEKCAYTFDYTRYGSPDQMAEADRELVAEALRATRRSYAPYSNFHVGAAARLRSGRILTGSNIESEVFPAGLCAERTLLFYLAANHAGDPVESLAIAAVPSERECTPCGPCRQALVDAERRQKSPIRVIMSGPCSVTVVERAELLLPFTFSL